MTKVRKPLRLTEELEKRILNYAEITERSFNNAACYLLKKVLDEIEQGKRN